MAIRPKLFLSFILASVLFALYCCDGPPMNDLEGIGGKPPIEEPEIEVRNWGTNIDNNGSISFGIIIADTTRQYTFQILNQGLGILELTGNPCIELSGSDAIYCSVLAAPQSPIYPRDESAFIISTRSSIIGTMDLVLSISNNDTDENPFTFMIDASIEESPAKLPVSGQTTAYETGDDGDIESGVEWPSPRFKDNEDGTTTDYLTGLMWETQPALTISRFDPAISYCNNLTKAGYIDWRLPNINELMSLINAEASNPAKWLNNQPHFSSIQWDEYWTSTIIFEGGGPIAWVVDFRTGMIRRWSVVADPYRCAWAVRDAGAGIISLPVTGTKASWRTGDDGDLQKGVSWPSPRLFQNENGTFIDALTGLIWAEDPYESVTAWADAIALASDSELAGFTDWRLPNRLELRSLFSYGSGSMLKPWSGAKLPSGEYWTSTTDAYNTEDAWILKSDRGYMYGKPKTEATGYAWIVRGGG